ncbi:hypothetical protein [Thioalkalivibrio sp. XN8]|uniref:serine O-acetyltransferase n=1 Tax=Thioalkalivibrio sp. XN8 TaxID=2712863 RepID=UPI001980EFC0|nr:hypothetical protein [Thioalkalivibrio sp. XN8]
MVLFDTPVDASPWISGTVGFLRDCMRATPLVRHLGAIDRLSQGPLADCVVLGLQKFGADLGRWSIKPASPGDLFDQITLLPTVVATLFYRINHELYLAGAEKLQDILAATARIQSGVEIYYSAEIGPGLKVIHGVGTVIGARSKIGKNFSTFQGVTIGDKLGTKTGPRPEIGDNVIMSAGSKVLGPISIGDIVVVGTNTVVIESVGSNTIVAGVPARVINPDLTAEYFSQFVLAIKG